MRYGRFVGLPFESQNNSIVLEFSQLSALETAYNDPSNQLFQFAKKSFTFYVHTILIVPPNICRTDGRIHPVRPPERVTLPANLRGVIIILSSAYLPLNPGEEGVVDLLTKIAEEISFLDFTKRDVIYNSIPGHFYEHA
jgi:hypothetical protein